MAANLNNATAVPISRSDSQLSNTADIKEVLTAMGDSWVDMYVAVHIQDPSFFSPEPHTCIQGLARLRLEYVVPKRWWFYSGKKCDDLHEHSVKLATLSPTLASNYYFKFRHGMAGALTITRHSPKLRKKSKHSVMRYDCESKRMTMPSKTWRAQWKSMSKARSKARSWKNCSKWTCVLCAGVRNIVRGSRQRDWDLLFTERVLKIR